MPAVAVGLPNTLLGKPVYGSDYMPETGDNEQVIAMFGDFRYGYQVVDRLSMSVQRLGEPYTESGLIGVRLHKRVGGFVRTAQNKPIPLLKERGE